jgi:uncharacterized protein YPO0396
MLELFGDSSDNNGVTKAGFRLQYLEVLNWGTFGTYTWKIEPNGFNSLLTGDIGSGKSTIVDAITCLLVPYQKITFNKAAGADGRERNLMTYVKGAFKSSKEELTKTGKAVYLRPDENTYSVVLANFKNIGYQEDICLAQLFWIKDDKIERLFLSSDKPLSVKEHFSNFSDIGELRRRLRKSEHITVFDSFSQYSENFRHRFGMTSEKAIDLFYQTVSMKSVSSLTDFVREQMLERTEVKEQIKGLLDRFENLNKAHEAVVHAREQNNILKPLIEQAAEYDDLLLTIEGIEEMVKVIPSWFAIKKQGLLEKAIEEAEGETKSVRQLLHALTEELDGLEIKQFGISQDIDNNGGRRLEQVSEEISRREKQKQDKRHDWEAYERLVKKCGLVSAENETMFSANIQKANELKSSCEQRELDLRDQRDQVMIDLRTKTAKLNEETAELESLKSRRTQIPNWLVLLRRQICADLRIEEDELPFAGELLKVREEEESWEGAIERLLHDFGISLIVPREHFRSVSRYVNSQSLYSDGRGRKLTCLEAILENRDNFSRQLVENSVVDKIDIKQDTPFYSWIESQLQKQFGDYTCVDIEELQHIAVGLTREGTIKNSKIRYVKDDRQRMDDRRNYILGWSNLEKIRALEEVVEELSTETNALKNTIQGIENEEKENSGLKENLNYLLMAEDFSSIDWYTEVNRIYELEQERKELLENNDLLKTLQERLAQVKDAIVENKTNQTEKNRAIGSLENKIESFQNALGICQAEISRVSDDQKRIHFSFIDQQLRAQKFRLSTIDQAQEQFRKQFEGESGELKTLRTRQSRLMTSITDRMRDIKEHSKTEYSELATDIEARGEYKDKYERLVTEDLKKHEERFKDELNRNTIQGITVFDNQLERHEKEIKQKIKHINKHLREIVYDSAKGTYIDIQIDNSLDRRISEFKADLKRCYIHALSAGPELYTEEKYEQVKRILDKLKSVDPIDKEWAGKVTDVRQWFEFNASERYETDDTEKEFYEGSGGKSGGQKEKLAYTILASALAYQFGLQFGEDRSRSFRFVVIDEAFGRGSDESTRYGLELFKKLNLQLLIVTPLQKIHIIENHVNSFHFVSNREGNHSQISNFSIEEYKQEKARRNSVFQSVNFPE